MSHQHASFRRINSFAQLSYVRVHMCSRDTCSCELMSTQTNFEYTILHIDVNSLYTLLLNYNFIFTRVNTRGTMINL